MIIIDKSKREPSDKDLCYLDEADIFQDENYFESPITNERFTNLLLYEIERLVGIIESDNHFIGIGKLKSNKPEVSLLLRDVKLQEEKEEVDRNNDNIKKVKILEKICRKYYKHCTNRLSSYDYFKGIDHKQKCFEINDNDWTVFNKG